ncbi:MAG TPA: heat-inducible transcriptional repressor HrcA [Bacillota bacterium]|nr:heat-inducible transcriptional repressor HrcA [Bacillota bacterium]
MLTERQLLILHVIIDDFIKTAQPVGSRAIAKKNQISYSPATIRNVMADLEDMGLIEKTHSSSGRIPSEKGYRYYVDFIVSPYITTEHLNVFQNLLQDDFLEMEQVIQQSAEILSELTNYTSIVLGPEVFETKLKQLQIVPLSSQAAVAILVTDTGHVEHRAFTIPDEIESADLEKMVNILNDRLYGIPIFNLPQKLNSEIITMLKTYVNDFEKSYDYLKAAFFNEHPVKLHISGKTNLIMQPEFDDVEKVRSFYELMEREEDIANLLKAHTDGIRVLIGEENEVDEIKDFSLITASYRLGEDQLGTIALLGPTRMEYRRVINLLHALSSEMTQTIGMWYKRK